MPQYLSFCWLGFSIAFLLTSLAVAGPQDVARNLLANPNFEEGVFGPDYWALNQPLDNRVDWLQSVDDREQCAVRLRGCGRDWAGVTSRRITVTAGETLTVGAWVLTDPMVSERDRLFVRFFEVGRFLSQSGPPVAGNARNWRLVRGQVTVPARATHADVSLQIWSSGTVLLHWAGLYRGDIAGEKLPAPPTCTEFAPVAVPRGTPEDLDRNGLPDILERALDIRPNKQAKSTRLTREKTTSFQTPTGYREDNDLKVDVIIVANNAGERIESWRAFGYEVHCMGGFRAGPGYVKEHPDEAQTAANGTQLTCGPGSYYMVPTENRRRIMAEYFAEAVRNGAQAVCPEEPEFFNRAGYSQAFKREWQAAYGELWQDPASSVAARFMAEQLKARLEHQLLADIYEASREVSPSVRRFLLAHSPLNYTGWRITFAHCAAIKSGMVDEMIAQVWTGTARTPIPHCGELAERTFENAFLEYSSTYNLVRSLDIPVWFLMDPVEDNPDRTMQDYRSNYERTLVASLMFPEVRRFEVMPWPTRIFGRVPDDYATEITSVVNVLSDMQHQGTEEWLCGTRGIATFIADSAMWQRGSPAASDMADIYGLATPLLMRGIPIQIAHLDRVPDADYLRPYHTLLLSYDAMKPQSPAVNEVLAEWVQDGGSLLICGGEDAYCAVPEWWREAGFYGPTEHLLSFLGFDVRNRRVVTGDSARRIWHVVARTDYTGRALENQTVEEIDLTPFLTDTDAVYVKFEDTQKEDGWGPLITWIELRGIRSGRQFSQTVRPGSGVEASLIHLDDNTALTAGDQPARFADGHRSIVYRFPFDRGTRAWMRVEVGNQYQISVSSVAPDLTRSFTAHGWQGAGHLWQIPVAQSFVTYDRSGAKALVGNEAEALVLEKRVGKGRVIFCGLPGRYFAGSKPGDEQLRVLVRRLVFAARRRYVEKPYIKLHRGAYVIAKTFGGELTIPGRYVNVLKPDLPVVDDPRLGPDSIAVLKSIKARNVRGPSLLFASSCVEWKSEEPDRTRLIVSGPLGVRGVCRLWSGGRQLQGVHVTPATTRKPRLETRIEDDTVLLTYDNLPNGMAIDVRWK